jgi:hypothetical protein
VRRVTARDLVAVWDAGTGRSAVGRALATIAVCLPGWSAAELAALPLGFRDALLLEFHGATFGPRLDSLAVCPRCNVQVEFSVGLDDLPPRPSAEDMAKLPVPLTLLTQGVSIEYRLPDSVDLDAIAAAPDLQAAAATLTRRCILSVSPAADTTGPEARDISQLPGELVDELEGEMARLQPWADIEVELSCPSCGAGWQPAIDVGAFVWAEIESEGRRLLREVDTLARTYGWSEGDILDMTAVRRQRYLEMAS